MFWGHNQRCLGVTPDSALRNNSWRRSGHQARAGCMQAGTLPAGLSRQPMGLVHLTCYCPSVRVLQWMRGKCSWIRIIKLPYCSLSISRTPAFPEITAASTELRSPGSQARLDAPAKTLDPPTSGGKMANQRTAETGSKPWERSWGLSMSVDTDSSAKPGRRINGDLFCTRFSPARHFAMAGTSSSGRSCG